MKVAWLCKMMQIAMRSQANYGVRSVKRAFEKITATTW